MKGTSDDDGRLLQVWGDQVRRVRPVPEVLRRPADGERPGPGPGDDRSLRRRADARANGSRGPGREPAAPRAPDLRPTDRDDPKFRNARQTDRPVPGTEQSSSASRKAASPEEAV